MKKLTVMAWDTATPCCTVALAVFEDKSFEVVAEFQSESGVHSQVLPSQVDSILKKAGLKPGELDLLVVGRGPGSFTGLRTGLALAKGLALGAGLPLMGLASTEPVAAQMLFEDGKDRPDFLAAPLIDARHGEIFTALYQAGPGKEFILDCLIEPQPLPAAEIPPKLLAAAGGRKIRLAGPALKLFLETLPGPLPPEFSPGPEELMPRASALACLAVPLFRAETRAVEIFPPLPMYMRQPDLRQSGIAMR